MLVFNGSKCHVKPCNVENCPLVVQLPLHCLTDDVATVKCAIELLSGPTVMQHSTCELFY